MRSGAPWIMNTPSLTSLHIHIELALPPYSHTFLPSYITPPRVAFVICQGTLPYFRPPWACNSSQELLGKELGSSRVKSEELHRTRTNTKEGSWESVEVVVKHSSLRPKPSRCLLNIGLGRADDWTYLKNITVSLLLAHDDLRYKVIIRTLSNFAYNYVTKNTP